MSLETTNSLARFHLSITNKKVTLSEYLPVLIQILIAFSIGAGILVASHIFGQKAAKSKIKDSPYECGLASDTSW